MLDRCLMGGLQVNVAASRRNPRERLKTLPARPTAVVILVLIYMHIQCDIDSYFSMLRNMFSPGESREFLPVLDYKENL